MAPTRLVSVLKLKKRNPLNLRFNCIKQTHSSLEVCNFNINTKQNNRNTKYNQAPLKTVCLSIHFPQNHLMDHTTLGDPGPMSAISYE